MYKGSSVRELQGPTSKAHLRLQILRVGLAIYVWQEKFLEKERKLICHNCQINEGKIHAAQHLAGIYISDYSIHKVENYVMVTNQQSASLSAIYSSLKIQRPP